MTHAPVSGEPRDPGLQPERTRLAWRRTTLSFTVVAVLAVKVGIQDGTTPLAMTGLALSALVWIGFLAVAHRRIRSLSPARPELLSHRSGWLAAGCVIALAVFGATMLH
ncbi:MULTISPECIES: DUF202 domain-containing protein [unclassified Streptomyces]|uniref:DUF202 domain-containing protein n=1 Tax=unclassified Streptomyces TaxID=2593676 RepID=UPI0016617720|nr:MULTISPECIES: DUF202 domain-containing protein [unclassified Streptomyces]MBD0712188.1 hypothetical protein [Streptomyces sp. CBMA291]MBD0714020.1 hypothetical protein [Streptomyces sp. CBMA370]